MADPKTWLMVATIGCSGQNRFPQLEAITVEGIETGTSGRFGVTGGNRDYRFESEDGAVAFDVHSPTDADLTVLDGAELTLEPIDGTPTDWSASDGAPVWLVSRGGGGSLAADEWFGPGFAGLGPELGRGGRRIYRSAVFRSDDGYVELVPGEVDTLVIDGAHWRVGVVAAWEDESHGGSKCANTPLLSYELLRVDAPVEPTRVDPTPDLELPPSQGCGG